MRFLVILTLTLVCVFAQDSDLLDTPDKVLQSEEAEKIIKCLLKEGECSTLATDVLNVVHKNFGEECAHCSPDTKHKLGKCFNYIRDHYPEHFERFMDNLDPQKQKRDFTNQFLAENQ